MNKKENIPKCIGIIMDGNRRWAKRRGKPASLGHSAGYKTLKKTVEWAKEEGIKHLVVYVFSTENWNRSKTEVSALMKLLGWVIKNEKQELFNKGVKTKFIGQLNRFSKDIQKGIKEVEKYTSGCSAITLHIAMSYGSRAEIINALKEVQKENKIPSEKILSKHLWTAGVPDPDIIIRTGGEMRLSNFLLWQSAYSELFFTKTLWPAFTKKEFSAILKEYASRKRNHGV